MTVIEYIQTLNKLKQQSFDRWKNLNSLEREVIEGSFDWLVDNLEIKRGEIQPTEELAEAMDRFVDAVVGILNGNKNYQGKLNLFLADLQQIKKNTERFHASTNRLNIDTLGVTRIQKAVTGEIIDQYLGNGLNAHFATPLREGIYRQILLGANMRDIKQALNAHILSGKDESGKLHRYLTQTAQQAADSYTGAINQQLKKDFKVFTGYVISGSLIATSSKQCVQAIETGENGYLTFKEWERILEVAMNNPKAKLIEGTTIDNLPLNKLHWGCRHDFTPIVKAGKVKPQERAENVQQANERILQEVEQKIRNQKFESAALVKDGKQLYFKDGEAAKVQFTEEEAQMMKGGILTHNHPSSRSFSGQDIVMLFGRDMAEIRAVSPKVGYIARRTPKTKDISFGEARQVYERLTVEQHIEYESKIDSGELTMDAANATHHHEVMLKLAKELNLYYERIIIQ